MSDFVLVHGAWLSPSIWDSVAAILRERGHRVATPNLPSDDIDAGAAEYAEIVARECAALDAPVVVGHTLAGLTLPLVPQRAAVTRLVYVNCVLPEIGRSLADQQHESKPALNEDSGRLYDREARSFWSSREAFGELLAADCTRDQVDRAFMQSRTQARKPITEVSPLRKWPEVPTSAILYRDDAHLDPAWVRLICERRLGVWPVELPGSQLGFVANPGVFADALLGALR